MTGTKKSTLFTNHFWSVLSLIPSLFLAGVASGCGAETRAGLFVFGDSIFDSGNNNYINTSIRANFWPYGETFFGYSTGRFTNGRTIPDFISEYAKLPLIRPYLQPGFRDYNYGVNFASSGAGVLPQTHQGRVIDLKTQLSYFNDVEKVLRKKLGGEEEAEAFLSSAVYLICAGGNDYFDAFDKNPALFHSQDSLEDYVSIVIGNLTNAIREIYSKGGRKFGFLNLSPMGCSPALRARETESKPGCTEELVQSAKLHNKELSQTLRKLADDELNGFKYSILDFFATFSQRSAYPLRFGFKEAKMACCGSGPYRGDSSCGKGSKIKEYYKLCNNPSEFLYFDSFHPTEKAYEQLAELFWTGNSDTAGPYGLKSLFEMGRESCGFQAS